MACAHQDAAVARLQREHMARRGDIGLALGRIDGDRDGASAVRGRNARSHPFTRFNRHGERGGMARHVLLRLMRQFQFFDTLAGQRQADQSAPVHGHEVDGFRRRHLSGDHQIAFIFAVFVVDQHEHAAVAGFFDNGFDGRQFVFEWHGRSSLSFWRFILCRAGGQHNAPAYRFPG